MRKIAFFSDKKGVGKSILSLIVGVEFKKYFEKEVCIVDLEDSNKSLYSRRKHEEIKFEKSLFKKPKEEIYSKIIRIYKIEDFQEWENWEEKNNYEFIIVDLDISKGLNDKNISFLLDMDYIFILSDEPENKEEDKLNVQLYKLFNKIRFSNVPLKKSLLVYNKITKKARENLSSKLWRENDEVIKQVESMIDVEQGYDNITTLLTEVKGSGKPVADEIYKIINNEENVEIINN